MPALILRAMSSPALAQGSAPVPSDLIAAATICLFLTTAAVCTRMFTKTIDLRRIQIDDYAIMLAGILFVTFVGLLFAGTSSGLGVHISKLSAEAVKRARLYSNVLDILYAPIMLTAKIAILIQIDRMFSGIKKKLIYWGTRVLIVLNSICYAAIFFAQMLACVPRAKIFDPSLPGKCISQNATMIATGTTNVASDIMILLFAVWGVSRLQLSGKRQTLVALVFSVGSFACVASVCRLAYGVRVDSSLDFTISIWPVHMWSLAELTSIIYVACCPTFPRLIQYLQGVRSTHPPSHPQVHGNWTSDSVTRIGSTSGDSNSEKVEKEEVIVSVLRIASPSPPPNKPLPLAPLRQVSKSSHRRPRPSVYSSRSCSTRSRTYSHFAPSERRISHLSYLSQTTAAIEEIISRYDPNEFPLTPVPVSPVSPARTEFSVGVVEDAVHMKMRPVYFATIKKTTDVRISSHTNPGSPMTFGRPMAGW